jgi:hypothetical protein
MDMSYFKIASRPRSIHEPFAFWSEAIILLNLLKDPKIIIIKRAYACTYLDNILELGQLLLVNLVGIGQSKILGSLALQLLQHA